MSNLAIFLRLWDLGGIVPNKDRDRDVDRYSPIKKHGDSIEIPNIFLIKF